ncbi:MAG: hypothetical protein H6849_03275 [Alphaproteobacteria bacterium]|nr:MAG: hypothetical protein H6849_03275 [Alphaproteobacteria bacterium]
MNKKISLLICYLFFCPIKASGWEALAFTTVGTLVSGGVALAGSIWSNPNQARERCRSLSCCWKRDPYENNRLTEFYPDTMPRFMMQLLNNAANKLEGMCPDSNKEVLGDGLSFRTRDYEYTMRWFRASEDPDPSDPPGPPDILAATFREIQGAARQTGRLDADFFTSINEARHHGWINLRVREEGGSNVLYAFIYTGVSPRTGEQDPFIFRVSRTTSRGHLSHRHEGFPHMHRRGSEHTSLQLSGDSHALHEMPAKKATPGTNYGAPKDSPPIISRSIDTQTTTDEEMGIDSSPASRNSLFRVGFFTARMLARLHVEDSGDAQETAGKPKSPRISRDIAANDVERDIS